LLSVGLCPEQDNKHFKLSLV